jgi:hypothetical protein
MSGPYREGVRCVGLLSVLVIAVAASAPLPAGAHTVSSSGAGLHEPPTVLCSYELRQLEVRPDFNKAYEGYWEQRAWRPVFYNVNWHTWDLGRQWIVGDYESPDGSTTSTDFLPATYTVSMAHWYVGVYYAWRYWNGGVWSNWVVDYTWATDRYSNGAPGGYWQWRGGLVPQESNTCQTEPDPGITFSLPTYDASGTVAALDRIASRAPSPNLGTASADRCLGKRATIVGTRRSNSIVGTRHADVIVGKGGNDRIRGRGGADYICAGPGRDLIRAGAGDDAVSGSADADRVYGDSGGDILFGDAGADTVEGGTGYDAVFGGPGPDHAAGGGQALDIIGYLDAPTGVRVNIETGRSSGGGGRDRFHGFNTIFGSWWTDTLLGSAHPDLFVPFAGNDHVAGGNGPDMIFFLAATGRASVHLADGWASARQEGTDRLRGIEIVFGTKYNDRMYGDSYANALYGLNGDDRLYGGGGDDILVADGGTDFCRDGFVYSECENQGDGVVMPRPPSGASTSLTSRGRAPGSR